MGFYPNMNIHVQGRLDPRRWKHIDLGGMIKREYHVSAPITQFNYSQPSLEQYEVRINPSVSLANPNLASWPNPENGQTAAEENRTEASILTSRQQYGNSADQAANDEAYDAESSKDESDTEEPHFDGGLMVFKRGKSRRVAPDAILEHAAHHTVKAVAAKEGIPRKRVNSRVGTAARVIAKRDGRFVGGVLFEHAQKQLAKGVIENMAQLMKGTNARARARMIKRNRRRKLPQTKPLVFPCVFVGGNCADHAFCKERYVRSLSRGKAQARTQTDANENDNDRTSLPAQRSYSNPPSSKPSSRDPRMNIAHLLGEEARERTAPEQPKPAAISNDGPSNIEQLEPVPYHALRLSFDDDPNLSIEWLDKMQKRSEKDPDYFDRRPPQKSSPLHRYLENGRWHVVVSEEWKRYQARKKRKPWSSKEVLVID
jgi:hypothetical protein